MWLPVTNTGSPMNRDNHTAVWTGREMIIWAGRGGGGGPLSGGYAGPTGGVYRPTCGAYVFEPQEGARVNREVTFRLHLSPAGAPRQAQLVVDGAPHGDPQTVQPDSRVKFGLGDELKGQHKLQVRTGGADGSQCLSPGPLVAMHEGVMLGPDAYGVYGEVDNVASGRVFVAMWLNYERTLAQALESYGHRVEATMRRVYGGWNNDPYFKELPQAFPINTNWDRFTTMRGVLPGGVAGACGSVHFPPNAVKKDYDYQHMEKLASVCDHWLKYPVLSGPPKMVNASTWGCNPRTDNIDVCEVKFLKWWYTHLPKAEGCNTEDGRLNNWWRYIVEPENYKADPVPRCDGK